MTIEGTLISGNVVHNAYNSFGGGVSRWQPYHGRQPDCGRHCFADDYRYSSDAGGGGIVAGTASIFGSLIADNRIEGPYANGGGILTGRSGTLTILGSTISGNIAHCLA